MAARKKSKAPRKSRFEMSDEEVTKRWQAAFPRHLRFLGLFALLTAGIFLYRMFFPASQTVANVLHVAFEVGLVFVVLFLMLVAMGWAYRRPAAKKTVD